jgi:hypothetical protein
MTLILTTEPTTDDDPESAEARPTDEELVKQLEAAIVDVKKAIEPLADKHHPAVVLHALFTIYVDEALTQAGPDVLKEKLREALAYIAVVEGGPVAATWSMNASGLILPGTIYRIGT